MILDVQVKTHRPQHSPNRASVSTFDLQGDGGQFIDSIRDILERDALQDMDMAGEKGLMHFHRFAVEPIHGWRVYTI